MLSGFICGIFCIFWICFFMFGSSCSCDASDILSRRSRMEIIARKHTAGNSKVRLESLSNSRLNFYRLEQPHLVGLPSITMNWFALLVNQSPMFSEPSLWHLLYLCMCQVTNMDKCEVLIYKWLTDMITIITLKFGQVWLDLNKLIKCTDSWSSKLHGCWFIKTCVYFNWKLWDTRIISLWCS